MINLRELLSYLFNGVRKQTLPRGPDCIVHGGQPLSKEDLSRVAILNRKEDFSEDQDNVLVAVVAHQPTYSTVAPPSVDKQQSVQIHELTDGIVS